MSADDARRRQEGQPVLVPREHEAVPEAAPEPKQHAVDNAAQAAQAAAARGRGPATPASTEEEDEVATPRRFVGDGDGPAAGGRPSGAATDPTDPDARLPARVRLGISPWGTPRVPPPPAPPPMRDTVEPDDEA